MSVTDTKLQTNSIRERHAGEHECDGSVGRAIYDPGTPCDAIEAENAKDVYQELWRAASDRADKAEAALAEVCADAERLAEAMDAAGIPACFPTSGGTDGVWCVTHDTPMVGERCEARVAWDAALAAHEEATK
jgi:hypothetical protein